MSEAWIPFLWVMLAFIILVLMQRWIHTHLHGLSLLLTGKPERAVILYAVVLLPGVLLHEISHWLMANLLGVRTGALSLVPRRRADGSVQLGYVEYYKGRTLDPLRESAIGAAPLLTGTAVILLIALRIFSVTSLGTAVRSGDLDTLYLALSELFQTNYILLWVYLLFAIGNGMLPSASDRKAWPAFLLVIGIVALVLYLLDLQDAVFSGLSQPVTTAAGYLSIAFSVAIGVNLVFMLLLSLLESAVSRLKGVAVVYGTADSPSK